MARGPNVPAAASAIGPRELTGSGSIAAGTPSIRSIAGSHVRPFRLSIMVRDALVKSVTNAAPRESRNISHESIVPKHSSPRAARRRSARSPSSSHLSLVPEK
jgi:hypothetical protein